MKDKALATPPVLSYQTPIAPRRGVQFGMVSTGLAVIVLAIVVGAVTGGTNPFAEVNWVECATWCMNVISFGFGAAGILRDRGIGLAVVGSLLSVLGIIFLTAAASLAR